MSSNIPTARQLAKQLGISSRTIREYWREHYPRPPHRRGMLWVPGVDITEEMVEQTIKYYTHIFEVINKKGKKSL